MKTRVQSEFNFRIGLILYHIQVLDHWRDAELRESYPNKVFWQTLRSTPDKEEALRCARAVADGGSIDEIVAEFGESDLVECEQTEPTPRKESKL